MKIKIRKRIKSKIRIKSRTKKPPGQLNHTLTPTLALNPLPNLNLHLNPSVLCGGHDVTKRDYYGRPTGKRGRRHSRGRSWYALAIAHRGPAQGDGAGPWPALPHLSA